MTDILSPRDRAYLDILYHGLCLVRNFTCGGRLELGPIEAEHLHELPTLIGEANESRHRYYLRATRSLYLEQLRALGDAEYLEWATRIYTRSWRVLAETAIERLEPPGGDAPSSSSS